MVSMNYINTTLIKNKMKRSSALKKKLLKHALISLSLFIFLIPRSYSQFPLNFIPSTGSLSSSVYQGGEGEEETLNNQTPFLFAGQSFSTVTDPETGDRYYHMIIGSAAEGFLQETYIEVHSVPGAMLVNELGQLSLSGTDTGDNGHDPLGMVLDSLGTGNGQANPRKVVMRQLVSDGEIMMEFKKDQLLMKPVIRQILRSPDVTALFQLDMSNSSYDDNTTPGLMTNILHINTPSLAENIVFDLATDADKSTVTGGRYTYSDGEERGGTSGSYQHVDGGGFDVDNVKWENFFDHASENPWAYPLLRPTP